MIGTSIYSITESNYFVCQSNDHSIIFEFYSRQKSLLFVIYFRQEDPLPIPLMDHEATDEGEVQNRILVVQLTLSLYSGLEPL